MTEETKTMSEEYEEDITSEIEPLILEPYTYENMIQNPVVKPIAEADRSFRAIAEMNWKKELDIQKDQEWIEKKKDAIPRYSESPFIAKLLKVNQEVTDIIKLKNLQIKALRECIKEVFDEIFERYAVKVKNSNEYANITTKIPEGSYLNYLTKLSSKEGDAGAIAKKILEIYNASTELNEDKKFQDACRDVYDKETERPLKKLISKIVRMEL